jgi:cyclopropane-fatty-acyl-phospholipid synthase
MRQATALHDWPHQAGPTLPEDANRIVGLLAAAGIQLNGRNPWDLRVHDNRFFERVLTEGSLGLGESYMDGWWDVHALDEFFARAKRAGLHKLAGHWDSLWLIFKSLWNLQSQRLANRVAREHYDLGNDLFEAMLDSRMQYSCAYWNGAATLDEAQRNKLDLICRKLHLSRGMRLLELGGGFGGFAQFAAAEYGCHIVSYNISSQQVAFARQFCQDLPVRFELKDYRDARFEPGLFDRIVSIGFCEHIGYKNYRTLFELAEEKLAPRGLFLLHTIGGNASYTHTDPWIDRYIFPNGMLPSIAQLGRAMEDILVVEDWHNLGPDYDQTLMAWRSNFDRGWPRLRHKYGDRFYRMWTYYLLASAGSFRARTQQLWQIVISKGDLDRYARVCS